MSAVTITAKFTTKDPLASHHTHSGHGGIIAVANIADGTIAFFCVIRCGLRLATGQTVSIPRISTLKLIVKVFIQLVFCIIKHRVEILDP